MTWTKDSDRKSMKSKIYSIHDISALFILLCIFIAGSASSDNLYSRIPSVGNHSSGNPSLDSGRGIKIAVITDIHFLDPSLVSEGSALSAFEASTGRKMTDLYAVLDIVLDEIKKEKPDILFITGDITNNGEKQSHLGIIEKLRLLRNQGIRVLVIPGNHDINIPNAKAYKNEKPVTVETVSKDDFARLYASFGYDDALDRDTASLSYLARVDDSVCLLCFDTNRYAENKSGSITNGRILPETMAWALKILEESKEKGITVLGMMHHGLVEHMPYQATLFPQYLVDAWEENANLLADAGLRVVFTGHFHANDITLFNSKAGNPIYDVETASLAQYPFAYRIMVLNDDSLSIDTHFISSIPGKPDLAKEYREKLEELTRQVAKNRLNGIGLEMSQESLEALTNMMVKMNLMHVKGDEKPDKEMVSLVRIFSELLDSDADLGAFPFDFPPEDNKVVIPVR